MYSALLIISKTHEQELFCYKSFDLNNFEKTVTSALITVDKKLEYK